ncbi:hypothetical protein J2S30_000150 [Herbaspirillum rubrisubalbicans]|uniref:hypothetical protein n=1 Tax=Herbaspirillum rubrisubalbicans TaxID=80842 RepID=UPI00209F077B|nr:hypothetical protein [Herbaspirillum rubrisubalbicans]MCP1571771.1 hypothetical protein [Herbaspirillum rubrisubalbicans]
MAALLSSLSFATFAQNPELDIRTSCEEGAFGKEAIYVITFVARSAPNLGHAYVQWAAEDTQARACTFEGYGRAPQNSDGVNSIPILLFRSVPGFVHVENGRDDEGKILRLFVRLDSRQYQATLGYARELNASFDQTYRLIDNDCVEFVRSIAGKLNLKVPKRNVFTLTPRQFMLAFIKQNSPTISERP